MPPWPRWGCLPRRRLPTGLPGGDLGIAQASVVRVADIQAPGVPGDLEVDTGRPEITVKLVHAHPLAGGKLTQTLLDGLPPTRRGRHVPPALAPSPLDELDPVELVQQGGAEPPLPQQLDGGGGRRLKGLLAAAGQVKASLLDISRLGGRGTHSLRRAASFRGTCWPSGRNKRRRPASRRRGREGYFASNRGPSTLPSGAYTASATASFSRASRRSQSCLSPAPSSCRQIASMISAFRGGTFVMSRAATSFSPGTVRPCSASSRLWGGRSYRALIPHPPLARTRRPFGGAALSGLGSFRCSSSQKRVGHEAKTQLSSLLAVQQGEEVIFVQAGKPEARLMPVGQKPVRQMPGTDKGRIAILPDFDEPLPGEFLNEFES